MKQLAQSRYTEQEIKEALHFINSQRDEVSFRFDLLDFDDRKIGELTDIEGSVNYRSLAQIKGTANFKFTNYQKKEINFLNKQIQPFFILKMPDGGYAEWSQGIYLMSSPTKSFDGILENRDIEAYDKTIILKQSRFKKRYLITKGSNVVIAIKNLIASTGIMKMDIPDNEAELNTDREYEIGIEIIEAVNEMLQIINYESIQVTETGFVRSMPYVPPEDRPTDYHYINDRNDIMFQEAEEELDSFNIPNVFLAVTSSPELVVPLSASFVNESISSPTSTVNRRREIANEPYVLSDTADLATLEAYVRRVAIEASQVYNKIHFTTATMPMHSYSDTLYIDHKVLKAPGRFSETAWNLELKTGGRMSHEARRMVIL